MNISNHPEFIKENETLDYLNARINIFNEKYKQNICKIHNKYIKRHPDSYDTHGDAWSDTQFTNNCNDKCISWIKEYVEIVSYEWQNQILCNLLYDSYPNEDSKIGDYYAEVFK